jgi:hypothetical protein
MAEAHAFRLVDVVAVVAVSLVVMLTVRAHATRHLCLPCGVDGRGWERIKGG